MAVSAAHQALRAATGPAHERLDAMFARFDLADRGDYARFLLAHAAALLPVEAWLDTRAPAVTASWIERRRTPAILADLAALGCAAPDAADVRFAERPAAVAGVLYVIEGSRLGGRILAHNVAPGLPRSYLAPERHPSWPALIAEIDRAIGDDGATAAAAAGQAFALFEHAGRAQMELMTR